MREAKNRQPISGDTDDAAIYRMVRGETRQGARVASDERDEKHQIEVDELRLHEAVGTVRHVTF